jgi:hypothetical protein
MFTFLSDEVHRAIRHARHESGAKKRKYQSVHPAWLKSLAFRRTWRARSLLLQKLEAEPMLEPRPLYAYQHTFAVDHGDWNESNATEAYMGYWNDRLSFCRRLRTLS